MKIRLGKVRKVITESQSYNSEQDRILIQNEEISIEKHKWDCNWYWGFGYIGNRDLHTHAKVFIKELLWHNPNDVFEDSIFKTDTEFWIFKDLLKQAYVLSECAEIYQYGGHCTTQTGVTDIIQNKEKAKIINEDLKVVLDKLWKYLEDLDKRRKEI